MIISWPVHWSYKWHFPLVNHLYFPLPKVLCQSVIRASVDHLAFDCKQGCCLRKFSGSPLGAQGTFLGAQDYFHKFRLCHMKHIHWTGKSLGGTQIQKKVGILVENFEIDPYGRPIWAWLAPFFTPKRD